MIKVGLAHLVVLLTLLLTSSVFAATCTVDTTVDEYDAGDDCSFREAVQSLNKGADFGGCDCDETDAFGILDTVIVPAGTYDLDIGAQEDQNKEGDVDIRVSMTIDGAGQGDDDTTNTIIRMAIANEADRDRVLEVLCFDFDTEGVDDGDDADGIPDCVDDGLEVTIKDVQVRDGEQGDNTDGFGGGILLIDAFDDSGFKTLRDEVVSTATLSNVNVNHNRVTAFGLSGTGGGGVGSLILSLTIDQGSTIHHNEASLFGGGIAAFTSLSTSNRPLEGSQLSILDSDVSFNSSGTVMPASSPVLFGIGGGVSAANIQTVAIERSTILSNESLTFGGGITVFLRDIEGGGGAIVAQQVPEHSSLVVEETIIAENRVDNDVFEFDPSSGEIGLGGGAFITAEGEEVEVLFDQVTLAANIAAIGGGLLYTDPASVMVTGASAPAPQLFMKNSSVYANQANADGFLPLNDCSEPVIDTEYALDLMAGVGGGVLNLGAPMAIENTTFALNNAVNDGGAIANLPNMFDVFRNEPDEFRLGQMQLTNVTLSLNQSHGSGGAIRNGISKVYTDEQSDTCPIELSSEMTVQNVILAGNFVFGQGSGEDCLTTDDTSDFIVEADGEGFLDSLGNNLFGNDIEADCGLTKLGSDFEVGVDGAVLGLGTFTDNFTAGNGHFPVLAGSTAIDNANADVCENGTAVDGSDLQSDQIFVDRVDTAGVGQDGANFQCEIGAIEFVGDCGNGVQEDGEECDDGNTSDLDSCKNDCTANVCGDGVINIGVEGCENGSQCSDGSDCTDNVLACEALADTTCAPRDGDGCSADCEPEEGFENVCGDGIIVPADGEECDDGNTVNDDGCSSTCQEELPEEPTEPEEKPGGCIGGGGCVFGACTESDERIDLSNFDNLSLYDARSLEMSRSNTYAVLFFLLAVGIIAAVRSRLSNRQP